MTEETPIYIQWPRGINGAIQGRLVDIDVDNGLCKLDCEFSIYRLDRNCFE
jgi:hypothetical protein